MWHVVVILRGVIALNVRWFNHRFFIITMIDKRIKKREWNISQMIEVVIFRRISGTNVHAWPSACIHETKTSMVGRQVIHFHVFFLSTPQYLDAWHLVSLAHFCSLPWTIFTYYVSQMMTPYWVLCIVPLLIVK